MLDIDLIPAADKNSRRLMIVLHGLGDSMNGFRWLPEALRLPWLNYLLVNAPDDYYGGFSWYDFAHNPAPGVERSRQLLFQLLDEMRERKFPTEQTVLSGFSQGCLMTLDTGLRYPHKLAALVGISGYVHAPEILVKEFSPVAREQRILLTHGTLDTMIPIDRVRPQIAQLRAAGLQIEWHEFTKPHTIAGEPEIAVIRNFISAHQQMEACP